MFEENIQPEEDVTTLKSMKNMGYTIVHKFAMEDNVHNLETCLKEGIDPSLMGMMGNTPLHLTTLYRCNDSFDLLMAYKADPNAKNNKGITPFHYAILSNNLDMVQKMLANNADVLTPLKNGLFPHEAASEISDNLDMSEQIEAIFRMKSVGVRVETDKVIQKSNNIVSLSFS